MNQLGANKITFSLYDYLWFLIQLSIGETAHIIMPRIRAHVFHCICDIGFRSAGSTRPLCSWASTCFYCYSLPCCTRCCWYRYGGRDGPRRWRCSIANLRLGKKNEWRHFASDTMPYHQLYFSYQVLLYRAGRLFVLGADNRIENVRYLHRIRDTR